MDFIMQQVLAGWDINTLLLVAMYLRVERLNSHFKLRISKIEWKQGMDYEQQTN